MFKCDMCGKITEAREKQHKKIVEVRQKTYYNKNEWGREKKSVGHEIVRELNICEECTEKEEKYGNS